MDTEHCPNCADTKLLAGCVSGAEGYHASYFHPGHLQPFRALKPTGSRLANGYFQVCLSCGHVWSHLDPTMLRAFIRESCGESAKQRLDALDFGPYRDLPDTALAHEIGDKIAEIDALEGTATIRRYRELKEVTWDEAIKDATHWDRLTREQKLTLFGWVEKKKPVNELAEMLM
jgi:hypothetical protein